MHELSIVEDWLATAREAAAGRKVKRLRVSVGEVAGVDLDALRFAFAAAAPNALGNDKAELDVTSVPARLRCGGPGGCGHEFTFAGNGAKCPKCGGEDVDWIGGLELRLDSMTVEEEK